MPRITGQLALPSFNKNAYIDKLNKELRIHLIKCWGAWLDAFLRVVPVWTGESVGSVLPLAAVIGRTVPIAPSPTAPGSRSSQGAAQSSAVMNLEDGKASITYQTNIYHLIINEQFDARIFGFHLINPGPYDFQGKGEKAFMAIASEIILPPVALTWKKLRL
jgi:hypothetical protein